MYVTAVRPTDLNRNTEWFTYPGVWTTYILVVFFSWLTVLCLFSCSPGMAWTVVHLSHFLVTYHFYHWKKGTPFADDRGIYNALTWWELNLYQRILYFQERRRQGLLGYESTPQPSMSQSFHSRRLLEFLVKSSTRNLVTSLTQAI